MLAWEPKKEFKARTGWHRLGLKRYRSESIQTPTRIDTKIAQREEFASLEETWLVLHRPSFIIFERLFIVSSGPGSD